MSAREELLSLFKKLMVGPFPLPGYTQDNGEEILFNDGPLKRYVTGVLFPQQLSESVDIFSDEENSDGLDDANEDDNLSKDDSQSDLLKGDINSNSESEIEFETSQTNKYKPSAMGLTLAIEEECPKISVAIDVGSYHKGKHIAPIGIKEEGKKYHFEPSKEEKNCFLRKPHHFSLLIEKKDLPTIDNKLKRITLKGPDGKAIDGLEFTIIYRLSFVSENKKTIIYTFTLLNTWKATTDNINADEEHCWFQCGFSVNNELSFIPLPDNFCAQIEDEDYQLNSLLYRDIKTYGIGHGCAATWKDKVNNVKEIFATSMPEYEVKPIAPSQSNAKLEMKGFYEDDNFIFNNLQILCDEYENWINTKEKEIKQLQNQSFIKTANHQIDLCRSCLKRMLNGISALRSDQNILLAFKLMNKAMLMQQLHYKLPKQQFAKYDPQKLEFVLEEQDGQALAMPVIDDEKTWYHKDKEVYGKWRPFQIAFILMNLTALNDPSSDERKIVDLIWFPTGGGKTEAYLGLTAYTIFLRRIKEPENDGTTVIMRYTLRLLTTQQFERASALICSMEKIRNDNPKILGESRITIGLWVGSATTQNKTSDAIVNIRKILKENNKTNPSIVLKCPWCGASMENPNFDKSVPELPGYFIKGKKILFKCGNPKCDYSDIKHSLPLQLFDDDIYENPPTLLFGTVDKFAILPFVSEAHSLFGNEKKRTPPELIIQDELHLITGPLGSSVGLYETLIASLCSNDTFHPKIVASTATISHAKEQCNALYNCGEDNVFQFPVPGITYDDCFFAKESDEIGRKYVGIYGSAAPSSATASIFSFAALFYGANKINVANDSEKDPYWTNIAYFNSMRELGQAASWFQADIKERLDVIHTQRLETSEPGRRYLYESDLAELTSRMNNEDIPKILDRLNISKGSGDNPLALCLATNMISVGLDIPRLGLMTVTGQPKSASEYIQATSRVGRNKNSPGLVFVIYNTSKSRDKSHYERFQTQHSKLYYHVEPTSITPFSRPLRERALAAILVGLYRFKYPLSNSLSSPNPPSQVQFNEIKKIIIDRVKQIDPDESFDTSKQLDKLYKNWVAWRPQHYSVNSSFSNPETESALIWRSGQAKQQNTCGWNIPTSMRNVDRECEINFFENLYINDIETEQESNNEPEN